MWEVLLDIDQLAISEGEDWLLNATASLPGAHGRTMLSLSRRGSDAVTLREFDIDAKAFARDSFVLRKPSATLNGLIPIRWCCRALMGGIWRRHLAMRARCGCGGAARGQIKLR
ncbi:hypothetical protein [Bradyrhizobium sp. 170]|uniref:hypothetical protein n=1 Tax=Bradyrhizobium sp. 170 TaxID=2782641 RepID=UPI001FFF8DE1|nr:hypothetical protein [Bradyrhizobium sp. 170]